MFKRLVFALNLASYMLYPHVLNGEMNLPKVGCTMNEDPESKKWSLILYRVDEHGKRKEEPTKFRLSEKEATKLCKEWRTTLIKHYTVPYQALLKKK